MVPTGAVAHALARPIDDRVQRLGHQMRSRAGRVRARAALVERAAASVVQASEDLEQRGAWLEREGAAGLLRSAGGILRRVWWLGLVVLALVALLIWLRRRRAHASDTEQAWSDVATAAPPQIDVPAGA